jgi:hypothetical protein
MICVGEQLTTEHSVRIIWGSKSHRQEMEELEMNDIHEYRFATDAELKAFLLGVDDSNGYMDYLVVEAEDEEKGAGA